MAGSPKPLLIFDFDGTLADTMATGIAIYNEIAPDYSLRTVTMEEVRELRKLNTRALLDNLGISRLLAVKLGAHIRRVLHERMERVEMITGIQEAVRELDKLGYRLEILSSNSADNVRIFLQHFELLSCFRFIEAGVSLFGKPQRIKGALRKQRARAENAMYVGDETRDMEAARVANVSGVAVCWGVNDREAMLTEGPEFCIDRPADLVTCAKAFEASRKKKKK